MVIILVLFFSLWNGDNSGIDLVGEIPTGLSAPKMINADEWKSFIQDAIPIVKSQFDC